jgi:CrcB protein
MYLFLSVACGGAIGALLRYFLSNAIQILSSNSYPYGILICNILGSVIMGLLYDAMSKGGIFTDSIRMFLQVGLLSSFTTFSAFSLEAFLMIEKGEYTLAITFILLSVFLSIGGLIVGINFARLL